MKEVKDKLNVSMIALVVAVLLTGCSNRKVVVVRDKDGNVQQEYYVDKNKPDVKNGAFMAYYPDKKLMESCTYKDGKLEGARTLYYPSGKQMLVEHYKNGEYEGEYKSYYEHGGLESEGKFSKGARDGIWKAYFKEPANVVSQEFTFKDNMINGPARDYYPNGKLNAEGNKIVIGGEIDVYDGKVQIYDSTGKLDRVVTYQNGRQVEKEEK